MNLKFIMRLKQEHRYEDVDFDIIRHVAFSFTEKKMTKELDQLLAKYKDIIIEGNARLSWLIKMAFF